MMNRLALTGIALIWSALIWAQLPEGFIQVRLAENLDPTTMTIAPDGRIFITEKNGRIRIVKNGQLLPDPFLSIAVDNFNERGLSGLALHPNFDRNHYVYVFYTVPAANRNRVSRFTANGDFAVPGSEEVLLEMDPLSGTIHNAGAMFFGPDGKLYIATGDGSDANNSQRLTNLLGKILRINDDGSIPEDNPFYQQTSGKNRAIWALGLRNPFTFTLQPGTGRIFANDVGGERFEEVNDIVKGGNYGWPIIEGFRTTQAPPVNYRDPLYAYSHAEGCAITGGAFYNPEVATFPPQYQGKYFFTDYCRGYMKVLNPADGRVEGTFMTGLNQPVHILTAPNGDLYYLMRSGIGGGSMEDNTSTRNGSLWRISYTGSGAPFISLHPASVTVPTGEDANFSVLALGKQPLSYQWQINNEDIPGATAASFTLSNATLSDDGKQFRCIVRNADGAISSLSATLFVTPNTRPQPTITLPAAGTTYSAGDVLLFAGTATDAEDGELSSERLSWRIDFHHDAHTHPALDPLSGLASGSFSIPQVGEIDHNVWYRIYLTATDSEGLSRTVYRDVQPVKTNFTIQTEPPGLTLNVDGKTVATPYLVTSVQGIRRIVLAPRSQVLNGQPYVFKSWANGDTSVFYTFLAGDQQNIVARFEKIELMIGDGTGLQGNYYNFLPSQAPESAFMTEPVLTRLDSVVNFNWVFGGPASQVGNDYFAVRWLGHVMPPLSGVYTFFTNTDDGVRLWVNDQLLIDRWVPQAELELSGTIALEAGKKYPIRMEFFELGGHALAQLRWSHPQLPKAIIPTSQLYPPALTRQPRIPTGESYAVRLTPNPATDMLYLEIDANIRDRVTWYIYDAKGSLIQTGEGDIERGANTFEIALSNFAKGPYFIRLTGRSRINGYEKFIKL